MLTTASERLIQFKRIAVLSDLSGDSENALRYAGGLARWYGSELLLVHADPPQFSPILPMESFSAWPVNASPPVKEVEEKLRSLSAKLNLQDLSPRVLVRQGDIERLLQELEDYRPSLLVLATHGREGIRKWLAGSVTARIFRQVEWPVLVFGPGVTNHGGGPQKEFERILYASDLSGVSLRALQYAAGIARDHEAQLTALYVDTNAGEGFSFDRVMELQRLEDWLHDRIDGLSPSLIGVRCVVEFGEPEKKIVDAAKEWKADLVVVGARGLGARSGVASHFLGGTAYEVVCSSPCPVLIVPQLR